MLKKNFLIIIILTLIFSIIIFFIRLYFFSWIEEAIEEEYIDKSLYISLETSKTNEDEKLALNNQQDKAEKKTIAITWTIDESKVKNNKINYKFTYIPRDFKNDSLLQTTILKKVVTSPPFFWVIVDLWIDLYKDIFDVRWKMKNGNVKLFWVSNIKNAELVAVFVHEVGHFIDIYYFNDDSQDGIDYSNYFYDIAWDSTKTINSEMIWWDFVSWYSMTNKYEDFAESFTYYILHNEDFMEKAMISGILKEKYDFFWKYLFKNNEFKSIDFWKWEKIKDYYWDITKIQINLENFLQYLKNPI